MDETFIFEAAVLWMFGGLRKNSEPRQPSEVREVLKWIRFATIEKEELHVRHSSSRHSFKRQLVDL